MMVDTTVHALIGDDGIVHNNSRCAPDVLVDRDGSHRYAIIQSDGSIVEAQPVYYLDDDGTGLSCDACGDYIFEPDPDYCAECGEWHDEAELLHHHRHHGRIGL